MSLPPSLTDPALGDVWALVKDRLERNVPGWRGRVTLPDVPSQARLTLNSVIDRTVGKTLPLDRLEAGLQRLNVADDLPGALARLGYPVSTDKADRRAALASAAAARNAARAAVEPWPEPWAGEWVDDAIRSGVFAGMTPAEAEHLVEQTRLVLDVLAEPRPNPISRVDLAARHLGSSHALDVGTRLNRAVTRALTALNDHDQDVWELAGAHADLVSGPALTWNLPLADDHPLATSASTATALGIPFLFTQLALREHPAQVEPGTVVLAVENPRVLEHAAQTRSPTPVICTNGNPSNTVRLLLTQLLRRGTVVRYHGDFDAAGLAICGRMHDLGLTPWRMGADDYADALDAADRDRVQLPLDDHPAPPTPWDPTLAITFDRERRIVHEERLLDAILQPKLAGPG